MWLKEDGSNPVHFAAAQGAAEMIRLMFTMQPDKTDVSIRSTDCMSLTPLHKAALFDRPEAIDVLLEVVSTYTLPSECS